MELVPRIQGRWNGDVWKVGLELTKSKNLKFYIADMDSGVGFLQKTKDKFIYTKIIMLRCFIILSLGPLVNLRNRIQ